MPVQFFSCGLLLIINGIVAHLAMGDVFINLPAPVHLAVQMTLGLNAGFVIRIDQTDLRGAAYTAGHHVFTDDIGNIQKINGL